MILLLWDWNYFSHSELSIMYWFLHAWGTITTVNLRVNLSSASLCHLLELLPAALFGVSFQGT